MAEPFREFTFRFGQGINLSDASAAMAEGQARRIQNWRITGRGRLSPRKAPIELAPAPDDICGIFAFPHAANTAGAVLIWDSANSRVQLYRADANGALTLEGTLAGYDSGVTSRPKFTGAVLNQALFLADTGKSMGLTVWDPNLNLGAPSSFFQPTFDFTSDDTTWAAAAPNVVQVFNNHLWIFGYGDEGDPDRGDAARISYLGLNPLYTDQGTEDAGTGGVTGSEGLFDVEDLVPVCDVGESVRGASAATGRMLVFTDRQTRVVFGSDRATWRIETIDDERGIVNELAACQLGGDDYWMSALGPCRYQGGGRVEPLDVDPRIREIIEEMDMDSVIAAPAPDRFHARWYYRKTSESEDGVRWVLIYDALAGAFLTDRLDIPVFAVGLLRPSGLEGPAGAVTGITHDEITDTQARVTWTPGDTSPSATQVVYRAPDVGGAPGTLAEVARYPGSVAEHLHTELEAETDYWTRIDTIRNGQSPASGEPAQASFTTTAAPVDPPPAPGDPDPRIVASDFPDGAIPRVRLVAIDYELTDTWEWERKETGQGAGSWSAITPTLVGDGRWNDDSFLEPGGIAFGTSYDYRFRETVDGTTTDWSNVVSVIPTADENPDSLL